MKRSADRRPLLSATEEIDLSRTVALGRAARDRVDAGEAEAGDDLLVTAGDDARRRMIEANLGLVRSIVGRTKVPAHVDREDLVQDGVLGLERAIAGFDWTRGHRFSTYATWWIRHAVQRGLETTAGPIRVPAQRVAELLEAEAEAERDGAAVPAAMAGVAMASRVDSLDRATGPGNPTLADRTASPAAGPAELLEAHLDRKRARDLVRQLDSKTAMVVRRRFGLDGAEPEAYAVIASDLGVSPEAVRRRVGRALDRMRDRLRRDEELLRAA